MFREMRRKNQQLSNEEATEILMSGETGVLGVNGDDGYPYTVPLNYVFCDNKLYFHCAKSGHKLDSIQKDSRVSFCVIAKDRVIPEKFSTSFQSVIVFGKAGILQDGEEKRRVLELLVQKYSPGYEKEGSEEIKMAWNAVEIVRIDIEYASGKSSRDLMKSKA